MFSGVVTDQQVDEVNRFFTPPAAEEGPTIEKDGNPEAALRSYEKALALNPRQAHATEGLKRLKK